MSRTHTNVSPSYLNSAIPCPASVTLAGDAVGRSSPAARLGTAKHELVEILVKGEPIPEAIEVEGHTVLVDEEMLDHAQVCVNFAHSLQETCDHFALEEAVNLDWYFGPNPPPVPFAGHVDCWGYNARTRTLTAADWKFGKKIVFPDGPQTMAYSLMLLAKFEGDLPFRIRLVIVQPLDEAQPIKHKTILVSELLLWASTVLIPALQRIGAGDTTENPGDEQCLFCRRAGECRALQGRALEVVQDAFDDAPLPALGLNDEEISYILSKAEVVEHWLRCVRAEAANRLERGAPVPGWKLVQKRANRKWSDVASVSNRLSHDDFRDLLPDDILTPQELRSPAQIEKAFKRNGLDFSKLEPFITRESSGTTLAPEDDKRPAVIGGDVASFFDQLD